MIWKTKNLPTVGDKRNRIIFAIVPRDCVDGHTRWLEKVKIFEVARVISLTEEGYYVGWIEVAAEGV